MATTGTGCEKSSWTPLNHAPSNQKIFRERVDLIKRWFSHWTELQRKTFLESLLPLCQKPQLDLLHRHLVDGKPIDKLDFTRHLPRCISLYIFTFLDPRSLSRAARVCWYWKMLTEMDGLWAPKCLRYMWRLPYLPSEFEQGAWKRLYISKVKVLRYVAPPAVKEIPSSKQPVQVKRKIAKAVDVTKLVWRDPDRKPVDLEKLSRKIIYEDSQNLASQRRRPFGQRQTAASLNGKSKSNQSTPSQKPHPQPTATRKTNINSNSNGSHTKSIAMATTQVDTTGETAHEQPFAGLHVTSGSSLHITQSDSALLRSSTNVASSELLSSVAIHRPKAQGGLERRSSKAPRRTAQDVPSAPLFTAVPTVASRSTDSLENG